MCVCVCVRERVCVCVCERERERVCVRERERGGVRERERGDRENAPGCCRYVRHRASCRVREHIRRLRHPAVKGDSRDK